MADDHNALHARGPTFARTRSRSCSASSSSSLTSIFESSLTLLGSVAVARTSSSPFIPIVHHSEAHGNIKLFLSDVNTEQDRALQSHLLWPAAVRLAERIDATCTPSVLVESKSVLEIGAGAALPSIISQKSGATQIVITDYPAPGILEAIKKNVNINTSQAEQCNVHILGLDWIDPGHAHDTLETLSGGKGFDVILAADTLWMSNLHAAQIQVMAANLARTPTSRVYIVAGLHSGRRCARKFLRECVIAGFEVHSAQEYDRKLQAEGEAWIALHWEKDEDIDEGIEEERRRWLIEIELGWP